MSGNLKIRLANPDDVDAIALISEKEQDSWNSNEIRQEFEFDFTRVLVALADEAIVGWCDIHLTDDNTHLNELAVDSRFRRLGAGRGLMLAALGEARQNGCLTMTLEVRQSNNVAVSLYESLGFRRVGLRKRFYHSPDEDAAVMLLNL